MVTRWRLSDTTARNGVPAGLDCWISSNFAECTISADADPETAAAASPAKINAGHRRGLELQGVLQIISRVPERLGQSIQVSRRLRDSAHRITTAFPW